MSGRFLGKKLSSFQIVILGFVSIILLGTVLLMLPISSRSGTATDFRDAIFTATSAVCVTGLVVLDTAEWWSPFGQAVLLVLIQTGGLGIVTVAAFFASLSGRRIGLLQRSMLQDTISTQQIGGVVKLTFFLFRVTFIVELIGALAMMPVFIRQFGAQGIWMSVFHSVSAFCNAGFDVMGRNTGTFSSLTAFADNPWIVSVLSLLIMIGGIGFLTWDDVYTNKWRFKRYRMQSKVILSATALLIVIPALFLFFGEYTAYPLGKRICLSLFQAVTPRTAGFNTADLSSLSAAGRTMLIVLMLIGGAPGSTAGGMKTTTAAVLLANCRAVFQRKKSAELFGRRIEDCVIRSATTLLMMYIILPLTAAAAISAIEGFSLGECLFETVSAIGTVGLSLGLTPSLGATSRVLLILLMFLGRVGGLTLFFAAASNKASEVGLHPLEKIAVG